MKINNMLTVSNNLIELFRNHEYEQYILSFMNKSTKVFPGEYEMVKEQSHGECDFIDVNSKLKYDAKLPFIEEQIELLTDGKRHKPQIEKWINTMCAEASDFNPLYIRNSKDYDIAETQLYQIMKKAILRDKIDEHIIFFLPYPISISISESILLQFCTDYLKAIYDRLINDICLNGRKIFAIYPASEKNQFALRDLSIYKTEYIFCDELEKYFSCEVLNVNE